MPDKTDPSIRMFSCCIASILHGLIDSQDIAMNRNKYRDEEILGYINRASDGESIKELCTEAGVSLATFYNWRNKFFNPPEDYCAYEKALTEENKALKERMRQLNEEKELLLKALNSRRFGKA